MSVQLSVGLKTKLSWFAQKQLQLSAPEDAGSVNIDSTIATGDGITDADLIWHDSRSIAASSSEVIDLSDGLVDALGEAIAFQEIFGVMIVNRSSDATNYLKVGAGSEAFSDWLGSMTDQVRIVSGGSLCLWAPIAVGYTVADNVADKLRIENESATASLDYDIVLVGN